MTEPGTSSAATAPEAVEPAAPRAAKRDTRLPSLDGLRGLAALVVVVHHCALTLPSLARQYQGPDRSGASFWLTYSPLHLLWAGGEAVLVFFVLSGLVLSRPFLRSPRAGTWAPYYRKRLLRLYVPVVAAIALTGAVVSLVPRRPAAGWSWWMTAHAVPADVSALAHDAFLLADTGWLNSALWSLKYEVFFSLLLPVFVVLARSMSASLLVSVPMALWGVGWAASIGHELLSYLFVFAVGVLLAQRADTLAAWGAQLAASRRRGLLWTAVLVVGSGLLLGDWVMKLFVADTTLWLPIGRPSGVLGAAVLVFAFLHCPPLRRLGESRALQWLGTVSFSLYLVHEPLVVSLATLVPPTPTGLVILLTVGVPVSLAVAVVFHRLVERPGQRLAGWAGRLSSRSVPVTQVPGSRPLPSSSTVRPVVAPVAADSLLRGATARARSVS